MGLYGVAASSLVMGSKNNKRKESVSAKPRPELVYNAAEDE